MCDAHVGLDISELWRTFLGVEVRITMKAKRRAAKNIMDTGFVQYASLIWRRTEQSALEVLLVTSRDTGRWVMPKGWPMKGKKPHEAAAQEALEEAGVIGLVQSKPYGHFIYFKRRASYFDVVRVDVFLLEYKSQALKWRESEMRQQLWTSPMDAANLVEEPGLRALLEKFNKDKIALLPS